MYKTPRSDHFWKLRCWKSARRCGAKHISKSKCTKVRTTFGTWDVEKVHAVVARRTFPSQNVQNTILGPLFEVQMSQKCTPLWREAHVQVKMYKTHHVRTIFGGSDVVSRGRRKGLSGLCTLSKVTKTWGFCSISKNDGRHGIFEEDLQRCIFVAGAVQKTCSWEMLGGQGADFLRFAKMILRDRSSTSYDLALIFRGRRSTLDRWTGKIAKTHWHESVSSALNFPFLKEVSQNSSFLMACTSKNEEVSQNCFVSDVVKFKKWRRLAELFRFGRSYVQTLRKSRRISSCLI